MPLPGVDCPVRSSGRDASLWSLEWTCGAGGAVTLRSGDEGPNGAWTDEETRVETPVEDSGTTGITNIRFPKCNRVRVIDKNLDPATPGTASNHRQVTVCDIDPGAGTASVYFLAANGGALADPETGSIMRLVLQLEYQ